MKLVVATRNAGKVRELRAMLEPLGYEPITLEEAGVHGEVEEDAATFLGNAEKKAHAALIESGLASLADDSGLEVDALGGAPGVHSARYAGAGHDDAANNEKLLHELSDIPEDLRSARFRCALVYLEPNGRRIMVEGACEGQIAMAARGSAGFGYDPLFIVDDPSQEIPRTMAEISAERKNRISHRARALSALVEALKR